MSKKDKIKGIYERKKSVNIKEVLSDSDWTVDKADYNEKTGKYDFEVSHIDGRNEKLSRNRQYVDNLIEELLDEKRNRG